MKKIKISIVVVVVVLIILLPYLYASWAHSGEFVFGGFLLNPLDGNSYLATMFQGWSGSWKFTLPYSASRGEGAYIFLYYIFLGHLSRWLHISLIVMYHSARVVNSVILLIVLKKFFTGFLNYDSATIWKAFLLASLGSGLGWLFFSFLGITSDFWVAEAFPFLSMYANPHFPLVLSLVLISIMLAYKTDVRSRIVCVLTGVFSALILPFGFIIAALSLSAVVLWDWCEEKRFYWQRIIWLAIGGLPVVVNQIFVLQSHPILSVWGQQNVTPSAHIVDVIVSFSPALPLALIGGWIIFQDNDHPGRKLFICWIVLGFVMMYMPISLQRRFMLGLFIPVVGLALVCINRLEKSGHSIVRRSWWMVFILSLPTNILILFSGIHGIMTHDPAIYLTFGESEALEWIRSSTAEDALILASPGIGNFLPAHTGRRVIYGHPFETVNAD